MFNLNAGIIFHSKCNPNKTAVNFDGIAITYAEFSERILYMAGYLKEQGINKGDVIALFMKNSPAFLEVALAASAIGAIFLPINYRLSPTEAAYILSDAGAKLLFVDSEFESMTDQDCKTIVLNPEQYKNSRNLTKNAQPVSTLSSVKADDLARLMYTSGTTSAPKGVPHTYTNMHWRAIDHITSMSMTGADVLLTVGPLYHVGAFDLPGIAIFEVGGTMCLIREFDPDAVLKNIDKYKINCGWMAPIMVSRVLGAANDKYDLSSFQWCIAGGERTPVSKIREFSEVFPNGRFVDGYGMTETCSGDTLMEPGMEIEKIGSTGRALAHVEIQIFDIDGKQLAANEIGEICIRGPKVTTYYWNAPEKTKESFFDGWLRSGDIGYLDEDGFLYVTDRSKDMILSGAENIASLEVENAIFTYPGIKDAAVVGKPDEKWGELIVAVIVMNEGHDAPSLEQLQEHCAKTLARFKLPRELHVVDDLPRNPSGKVLKRTLRKNFN